MTPQASVTTVDYHTAGEPFRIVPDLPSPVPGQSVADKRIAAIDDPALDGLRRLLCFEPRGHADMYGGFLVPPDDDAAHLGVLFWHKDGFSTAGGHGTIALGAWAIDEGLVAEHPSGVTDVRIDVPSGRVTARVHSQGRRIERIDFVNVASYQLHQGIPLSTSRGEVSVNVSYGGEIYAQLSAASVGLAVKPEHYLDLLAIGREIKWLLNHTPYAVHPSDDRLSGIYGTILYDVLPATGGDLHQRNVTVFADGQVDRSPCGSGTAARVADLAATGRLAPGQTLIHDSIVGSRFHAQVIERTTADGQDAVVPEVSGTAHRTGRHEFELDPDDALGAGFVLR